VRAHRSFRVQRAEGPVRSVVGPGVLAAGFALLLSVVGAPAHIGAVGPDVTNHSVPLLVHRSPPTHALHRSAGHSCGEQHRVIV
jgi:hypothetical protein